MDIQGASLPTSRQIGARLPRRERKRKREEEIPVTQQFFEGSEALEPSKISRSIRKLRSDNKVKKVTSAIAHVLQEKECIASQKEVIDPFEAACRPYLEVEGISKKERKARTKLIQHLKEARHEQKVELEIDSKVSHFDFSLLLPFSKIDHLTLYLKKAQRLEIPQECPSITKLTIHAKEMEVLQIHQEADLEQLELCCCENLLDFGMKDVSKISSVSISDSSQISSIEIENLPSLEKISIQGCLGLSFIKFEDCFSLKTIELNDVSSLQELWASKARELVELNLDGASNLKRLKLSGAEKLRCLDLSKLIELKTLWCKELQSLEKLFLPETDNSKCLVYNLEEGSKIKGLMILNHQVLRFLGRPLCKMKHANRFFTLNDSVKRWMHRLGELSEFSGDGNLNRKNMQSALRTIFEKAFVNEKFYRVFTSIAEEAVTSCEDRIAGSIFDLHRFIPVYDFVENVEKYFSDTASNVSSPDNQSDNSPFNLFSITSIFKNKNPDAELLDTLTASGQQLLYYNLFLFHRARHKALELSVQIAEEDPDLYGNQIGFRGISHKEELAVYLHLVSEICHCEPGEFYLPSLKFSGEANSGAERDVMRCVAQELWHSLDSSEEADRVYEEFVDFLIKENGRFDVLRDILGALRQLDLFTDIADFQRFVNEYQERHSSDDPVQDYNDAVKAYEDHCSAFTPTELEFPLANDLSDRFWE